MTAATTSTTTTPDALAPDRAKVRPRRWPAVVGVLLIALVGAWLWIVPAVVERTLVARLREAGFANASIGAVAVAFDRVDLRDLRLANGAWGTIDVPSAVASFRLTDLFAARVDTLVLEQPVWTLPSAAMPPTAPTPGTPPVANQPDSPSRRVLPELPVRRLEVHAARIVAPPGAGFAIAGVDGIDVVLATEGARWQMSAIGALGGHRLRAGAQLDVGERLAVGNLDVRLLGVQPLQLAGACRLELVGDERVADLELKRGEPPFDFEFGSQTLRGSGGIELRAHVPFAQLAAATLDVQFADLSVTSGSGVELDRLAGRLALTGLPRPVSAGPQSLRWQGIRYAKVAVGTGEAHLELRPDLELLARVQQRAQDEVGSFEIRGVRLAPGTTAVPATVAFDEVSLKEWLELLSQGRVTGEGRMTGTVDVVVQTQPRFDLDLRGGQVSAVRGGLVRFLEDEATRQLIRQHAEQIAAASGHGNVVTERIVGALEEFEYSALEFRIERSQDGGVTLAVHTAGQGRKVPQQLELDVNLHGFDAAVDTALALKLGLDQARRRLDDKVERGLTNETNQGPEGQRKR